MPVDVFEEMKKENDNLRAQVAELQSRLPSEFEPRPYDMKDPSELRRLFHEARGYIYACRSHGGDTLGRKYAIEAFEHLKKNGLYIGNYWLR